MPFCLGLNTTAPRWTNLTSAAGPRVQAWTEPRSQRRTDDNIKHLLDSPHFELIRHDVTFPLYVEVDEIYNLACPASPIHYQHDPVQTTKTRVHGAINMVGLAKRVKAKIFQASTSEVYGDPEVHPQMEGYWGRVNPIGTRACYDEGKRCAETLFFDYHRQHRMCIKVARIFNTYGPRMHPNDGRVVSNFIVQALHYLAANGGLTLMRHLHLFLKEHALPHDCPVPASADSVACHAPRSLGAKPRLPAVRSVSGEFPEGRARGTSQGRLRHRRAN